ncbi:uncharacterized protein LOC129588337 [Paramacrobiotus metropolitanus]|uniref:uncharacterized protein LOC129588337 n=1 Tax=Paramacrobiotus metropolitanus TaxID=2943436 RepID=UPI002445802D|nr:uncharacterized protein LOC129588337 [Paramacrobiotus metropolitanus]
MLYEDNMESTQLQQIIAVVFLVILFPYVTKGFALRLFDPEMGIKHNNDAVYAAVPPPATTRKPSVTTRRIKIPASLMNGFMPRFVPPNRQMLECATYAACKEKIINYLNNATLERRKSLQLALLPMSVKHRRS